MGEGEGAVVFRMLLYGYAYLSVPFSPLSFICLRDFLSIDNELNLSSCGVNRKRREDLWQKVRRECLLQSQC